jgi:hypothetical protein
MPASLLAGLVLLLGGVVSAQTPQSPLIRLPALPLPPIPGDPAPTPVASTPPKRETTSPFQLAQYKPPRPGEDDKHEEYQIQVIPPGLERFTRLDSDAKLFERIRQETITRDPNERVEFPASPILSRERYRGRGNVWAQQHMTVEPNLLYYRHLFFEDKNSERYGWDFGAIQPEICLVKFWFDFVSLPMKIGSTLCDRMEANTGYCLPGDPVPYLLYPPDVTVPGSVAELGVIAALIAMFP